MTPTRQIIAEDGLAFVDLMSSYPVDTSALPDDVAFVGIEGDYRWIERQPFAGREIQIDAATTDAIDAIFADADAQHQARLDADAEAQATKDDTTTDATGAA